MATQGSVFRDVRTISVGQKLKFNLFALALLLLLVGLFGCGGRMSPSTVVEKYWTLVSEGEYEKALQYVASEAETQMMFAMSMSQIGSMFGLRITDVVTRGENISGNTAVVRYYFYLSDGSTTDTDDIELVKENGRWKIGLQEAGLW